MIKPEILAPAGSMESLKAAVYCGANAVYLGGKNLNARRNAGNFEYDELCEAVSFCHERDVKVYQTLNILMMQNEREELISAVKTACELGIDGVMVQDLGVLSIMNQIAPELPVFASTQMAVHNLAGVKEAARLGCKRVVLARELSKGEISYITQNSPIPIEVFVHGALCMCVSGQCYLSSMLGGRSGNRGLCAQPCRLPFAVGEDSHALSLKDLTLAHRIGELADVGVASLKIEGRMKRPEYVASAVTTIKAALDGKEPDLDTLQKVFSRSGFTDGYFSRQLDHTMFGTRQREDVVAATDVLGELSQLAVREQPLISLNGEFFAGENQPMTFKITDGTREISTIGEVPEIAINKATDQERLLQSLNKTGGTPYYFNSIDVKLGEGLMLKASQLNLMRRTVVEQLSEDRRKIIPHSFNPEYKVIEKTVIGKQTPKIRVRCDLSQLTPYIINSDCELTMPLEEIKGAIKAGVSPEKLVAEIPRILFMGEDKVSEQLVEIADLGVEKAYAQNIGAVGLAADAGLEVRGGWALNVVNSYSVEMLKSSAVQDIELSFELMLNDAKRITGLKKGILAYGNLPLMTFRNCPIKSRLGCEKCNKNGKLIDRKGIEFTVTCKSGMAELLNSVPLFLADRFDELNGFDFVTLWFTNERKEVCEDIFKQYSGCKKVEVLQSGHTRGLYYRGII